MPGRRKDAYGMSKILTYNAEFMDGVSNNYKSCAYKTQEAIDELNQAKNKLLANYEGQGNNMAQDVFAKVAEHLDFLHSCLNQAGQYVTYTKETMQELDKTIK
jgi:uncharacterized protein YukE